MQTLRGLIRKTGLRRQHVASARMYCERNALAWWGRRRERKIGRILCYHSVGQPLFGVNDVSPAHFRRHIELALGAGLRFVPASDLARDGGSPKDVAITFDDGLRSVMRNAAPILADYNIPWSLFVVSDWSDGKGPWGDDVFLGWRDLERLIAAGVEVGSHSATHPDFTHLDLPRIVEELGSSRRVIEDRLGIKVETFAIPFGQSMNWPARAAQAARQVGYEVVYAQAEETRPIGTIPRTFVTRFDGDLIFNALMTGVFDRWEEWY
jgi:peptidoglycan/xylan/chitin deacetylase (PgdA/CDA1 family)